MSKTKATLITIAFALIAIACSVLGFILLTNLGGAIHWYCPPMC